MADGDIWLPLLYEAPYVSVPDPVPPPMGSCGAELYEALRYTFGGQDHANGWTLAHLCEGMGRMRQAVSDIGRASAEGPGWSALLDVDRCPGADSEIDCLPWLGQMHGVLGITHLSDAERRAEIRDRRGFWRGTLPALVSYAMSFTDGTPGAVHVRRRFDPRLGAGVDAPAHGQIRIKRSRLAPDLDEAEITAKILARVPAGLIYEVEITDAADFEDVRAGFDDFTDLRDSFDDFADLRDYEP